MVTSTVASQSNVPQWAIHYTGKTDNSSMTCHDKATSQKPDDHIAAGSPPETSPGKSTLRRGGGPFNLSGMRLLPFKAGGKKTMGFPAVTCQYVCCVTVSQQKLLLLSHSSPTLPCSTAWPSLCTCKRTTAVVMGRGGGGLVPHPSHPGSHSQPPPCCPASSALYILLTAAAAPQSFLTVLKQTEPPHQTVDRWHRASSSVTQTRWCDEGGWMLRACVKILSLKVLPPPNCLYSSLTSVTRRVAFLPASGRLEFDVHHPLLPPADPLVSLRSASVWSGCSSGARRETWDDITVAHSRSE